MHGQGRFAKIHGPPLKALLNGKAEKRWICCFFHHEPATGTFAGPAIPRDLRLTQCAVPTKSAAFPAARPLKDKI